MPTHKEILSVLGQLWGRWLDTLGSILLVWNQIRRARHPFVVSVEGNQIIIRKVDTGRIIEPALPRLRSIIAACSEAFGRRGLKLQRKSQGQSEILGVLPPGSRVPDDLARALMVGLVNLEVPQDSVVLRWIRVPSRAREFLPGIIRNQIEHLSPWPSEQVLHGFDVKPSADGPAELDVRVFITSRSFVNNLREQIVTIGLAVDRIFVCGNDTPVILWSRIADTSLERAAHTRRMIGGVIGGLVVVSFCVSFWAFFSASSLRSENEEMASRSRSIQLQLKGSHSDGSSPPPQRAWISKETSPSVVVVLEALSRALPDSTYLTELSLENAMLRIIGFTEDAPSLIAPLEQSGQFTDVRFFAPTTRSPDTNKYNFHIEAQVVPRMNIAEK
jgi:general secretion pathway protein L